MNERVLQLALDAFAKGIYKKNIHYIFRPGASTEEFNFVKVMAGSSGQSAWMIEQMHYKMGVQMQVSKQVSNDLIASDFSQAAKVEDVPWPAPVVELYFEDPALPTILMMRTTPQTLEKTFPNIAIGLREEEYITALMQEGSSVEDGKMLSLQLKPDMYPAFLESATSVAMETALLSSELNEQDHCALCYMLHLAFKVFVFASIVRYKPAAITRKQMTWGGKPEVKGRPNRPAFKVTYAPKIVTIRPKEEKVETEHGTHEFKGRRGFIRWYHHERFTSMKGKWDIIEPVADPRTGKYPEQQSIIKVRKPI